MAWPTLQDYNEAVQSPDVVFSDGDLRKCATERTPLGLPKAITGNFASVYRFVNAKTEWAVRCFHREYPDQRDRYSHISRGLADAKLPYTVPFVYLDEGVRIRGSWYPILKMRWISAPLLLPFVDSIRNDPRALRLLAKKFKEMMGALKRAGIAHGDLQHGNVLVVNGDPKLIDYDGMYVPSLEGRLTHEIGHPNFQHPGRSNSHYGPELDHFSSWVIYLSLFALAADPSIWDKTGAGDEALLFRKADFDDPGGSEALRLVLASPDREVRSLADRFKKILSLPVDQVPDLDGKPGKAKPAPKPQPQTAPAPQQPAPTPPPPPKPAPASPPPKPAPKPVAPPPKPAAPAPGPASTAPAWASSSTTATASKPAPLPAAWKTTSQPSSQPAASSPVAAAVGQAGPSGASESPWFVRLVTFPFRVTYLLVRALVKLLVAILRIVLVLTWRLLKVLTRIVYEVVKATLWSAPRGIFSLIRRLFAPGRSRKLRLATAAVVVAATAVGLHFFFLSYVDAETCEFLARPTATLYIDGKLASESIPPIHREKLRVGEHFVQFVGPDGEYHEVTIDVVKGSPTRWFMNFVDGRVVPRPTAEDGEE